MCNSTFYFWIYYAARKSGKLSHFGGPIPAYSSRGTQSVGFARSFGFCAPFSAVLCVVSCFGAFSWLFVVFLCVLSKNRVKFARGPFIAFAGAFFGAQFGARKISASARKNVHFFWGEFGRNFASDFQISVANLRKSARESPGSPKTPRKRRAGIIGVVRNRRYILAGMSCFAAYRRKGERK